MDPEKKLGTIDVLDKAVELVSFSFSSNSTIHCFNLLIYVKTQFYNLVDLLQLLSLVYRHFSGFLESHILKRCKRRSDSFEVTFSKSPYDPKFSFPLMEYVIYKIFRFKIIDVIINTMFIH